MSIEFAHAEAPETQENAMTVSQDSSIGRIVQTAVPSKNLDASKEFYGTKLGLKLLFEAGGMAFYDGGGGVRFMVGPPEDGTKSTSGGAVYFEPDDIIAARKALEQRGVEFLGSPEIVQRSETHELQLHFFRDPDDNLLALMGHVAI